MSAQPANPADHANHVTVGSVRRFADDRSVTLHVDGSRNALTGAAMFALVPLACLALGGWFCLASSPDTLGSFACFAVVGLGVFILPSAAVLPTIKRLLATALTRVTLDADAAHLRLLAFGAGPPACLTWRRDEIRDVRVHTPGSGIYELHILLAGERFVPLLYGVRRDDLAFIASELCRALGVDARATTVAGWWGDAPANASADDKPGGVLDYAPQPMEHAGVDRTSFRARVFIPPPRLTAVLRQRKWSLAVSLALALAILLAFDAAGWVWAAYAAIILATEAPAFLECVRRRSVEVDGERVTLTVRTRLAGERVRTWPADAVTDIRADGSVLHVCFRDGTRAVLATLVTPAAAAALARSLRPDGAATAA